MNAEILDITPDEYHALPHFSSSMAKTLISRSPRHAREIRGKPPTKEMDFGTVGHRLVLGKGKDYAVLPFDDWRTKAAKESREAARAEGLVPIKHDDFTRAEQLAGTVRTELLARGLELDGESEIAITWEEQTEHGVVLCKAMLDHAWLDAGRILDLKFTENAAPFAIERNAESLGYAIQRAAYVRAITQLRPSLAGKVDFLFAFCETESPFAVNLTRPDGMFREIGDKRWARALATWARCLAENDWPAYGAGVNQLSAPPWALRNEEFAADDVAA